MAGSGCTGEARCGHCSARRRRGQLRDLARELADRQAGVVSRSQLADLGLTRWQIEAELKHVSTPKSCRPRRPRDVVVHETRRRQPGDLVEVGLPRVRPPIAAIRAALWARSDRQAALVLAMSVQQRITTPEALNTAFATVRRHRRRKLIGQVLADVANGAQSIGELDFARLCRKYGLPEPDRQTRRRGPDGVYYLDSAWTSYGAVVEIDGLHHLHVPQVGARQHNVRRPEGHSPQIFGRNGW